MRLTRREMILAWAALLLVLAGILWAVVSRNWAEDRRGARERATLARRLREAERLLAGRPDAEARLAGILDRLPSHAAGQDVTADLLREVERLARDHGVSLTRREAERERRAGELFEVSVSCSWEADLDSLVRFLYALESGGAMRQIRQLSVSSTRENRLRGTVLMDHAYRRGAGGSPLAPDGEGR